jgi:DNA-binding response OmpR family regulator
MARILVVDDESNIRMMIRLALQQAGHTVDLAIDGLDGLKRYRDGEDYDLVLLDHRMPGMDGLEVLKEIRHCNSYARVVMITAFGTVDLAVSAMKAGATDFLRKPFTADTLRGAVRAALGEQPTKAQPGIPAGITFGVTTLNGFRIEFQTGQGVRMANESRYKFTVRNPEGEARDCTVTLPSYVQELVKAQADVDVVPHGERFWEGFCETSLANYLWQNSDFPENNVLRIDELTGSLRKWVNATLHPEEATA